MKTLKHFALTVTIICLFQLAAHAQNLSGTWYSSDNAPATFTQNGSSVTGTYRGGRYHESLTGRIEGTFDGRTLRCTYRNQEGNVSGSGSCYFTLNGNQLVGRWEGGGRSGEWVLTRSGGGGGGTLTGDWNLSCCDGEYTGILRISSQDGATFSGSFENIQAGGAVRNGQVRGNRIDFDRIASGFQQHYSAELVNDGGRLKMINGVWSGAYQERGKTNWHAEKR